MNGQVVGSVELKCRDARARVASKPLREQNRKVVQQGIGYGDSQQRQEEREGLSADDHAADGLVYGGPFCVGDERGHHSGDEGDRCHENRTEAFLAGLNDGVVESASFS
jgi:hypothetical protein